MLKRNIILSTDSYNASHYLQYPAGSEFISFYIESRGGEFDETVMAGLQPYVMDYLMTPITLDDIDEAEALFIAHGEPFNREGWEYILDVHNGYLPIRINAVPEGLPLKTNNVLVQVINTDPKCFWLNIEPSLLRAIWYSTTVATKSRQAKQIMLDSLIKTANNTDSIDFMLHDFGARGVSSGESAMLGGMAHLINFMGTDTVEALRGARYYYGINMAGFSIPAAQHSTITSWTRLGEASAYENLIDTFGGPGKKFAIVIDSYDMNNVIDNIFGKQLRDKIINNGGTLVVRPDSGNPVLVAPDVVARLMTAFGYTVNEKGYKVLPDYLRVIQGDGVYLKSIQDILDRMESLGMSAENIAFGMGGDLLQKVNRDTQKFAMKASAIQVNGEWRDIYKDPITDPGKRSKAGILDLVSDGDDYMTVRYDEAAGRASLLEPVFENGRMLRKMQFEDLRRNADIVTQEMIEAA